MDDLLGYNDIKSIGQDFIDRSKKAIADVYNSKVGAVASDVKNRVQSEVNQINSRNRQKFMTYQNCLSAYNQALSNYNACMSTPPPRPPCGSRPVNNCSPFIYTPLDPSAIADGVVGNVSGLGAAVADKVEEDMRPPPDPNEAGDTVYHGFLSRKPPKDIVDNIAGEMKFDKKTVKDAAKEVIRDHFINNISNLNISDPIESTLIQNASINEATNAMKVHMDIDTVMNEIHRESKQKTAELIGNLKPQRKKFMCLCVILIGILNKYP